MRIGAGTVSGLYIGTTAATAAYLGTTQVFGGSAPVFAAATGGTETTITQGGKTYRVHTFLTSGTLTVTQGGDFEYLIVGGGGPGGFEGGNRTGGGGSGADVLTNVGGAAEILTPAAYTITVGAGGVASLTSQSGQSSTALSKTALGGGWGYNRAGTPQNPADGGGGGNSGLGAAHPTSFLGGNSTAFNDSGGGRGAAGNGQNASAGVHAQGGAGVSSSISGAAVVYGMGGQGANRNISNNTRAGGATPGSGGDGAFLGAGFNGANGIVIVRYEIAGA